MQTVHDSALCEAPMVGKFTDESRKADARGRGGCKWGVMFTGTEFALQDEKVLGQWW